MHRGYIKVWRKITEWGWYKHSATLHLFFHLLLHANYKPKMRYGVEIERGQILTGRSELALSTGLSEQVVRSCLGRLKSTSEITIKSTNKFSIITLCNYEKYCSEITEDNQQINQQIHQPATSNQPAINQQLTTTKKDKKVNNVKKDKNKEYIYPLPENPELEKPKDFCLAVIEDLNAKAGKNYRPIKTTITLIESRRKEGFTLDDFQKVHDNMCAKWKNDPKMNQYLRPATLYQASKFEGYLNTTVSLSDRGLISEKTEKGLHNVQSWLEKEQAKEKGNAE